MMLDDFFTLAEIKDGLTSQSRVDKLVKIMQIGSPGADRNFAEAAGQRSAVASVLAATRSKDCLYLFIKLNGLHFFNLWLQDAQRVSDKDCVSAVEESLGVLIDCLEKLPSDEEDIKSSGIAVTIKQLCDHSNPSIHSQARALFSRWNEQVVYEKVILDRLETCDEDPSDKGPAVRTSSLTEVKTIDDAEPGKVKSSQTRDRKISGNLGDDYIKKLGDEEMSESPLLDPCEMDYSSNHRNGSIAPETQHGEINLKVTKESHNAIILEPEPECCDHLSNVLLDDHESSDKSKYTVFHTESSVSVRDSNEPIEEAAGDDHLVLPYSGLKAVNKFTGSDEVASELENMQVYEVGNAQQRSQRITHETEKEVDSQFCSSEEHSVIIDRGARADSRSDDLIHGKEKKPNLSNALSERVQEYDLSLRKADKFEAFVHEEPMELSKKSNRSVMNFDLNQEFDSADAVEKNTPPRSPISDPSLSNDSSHITTGEQDELGLHVQGTMGSSSFLDDLGKVSAKGSSCITKHRQDLLDFDLNVADNVINIADGMVVTDQIPARSSLPSSESSIEVSTRIDDRQELDLNCPADDPEPSSNVVDRKVLHCSLDEPSSGVSSKINFDLNETLSSDDEYSYCRQNNDGFFHDKFISSVGAYSRSKPALVLMGSRVEIDRRKVGLSLSKLPNIQKENSSMPAVNCLSRPNFLVKKPAAFSVTPPSVFHVFPPKPSSSSSSFCGPGLVTHNTKSVGAPTIMHMAGKSSPQLKPSFFFVDANHDSDAVGSSNCSSPQNFNLMMVERRKGSLESSGPCVNQYMDGQRSTSQYPNSNGSKRKEPNDGWQPHQFNFTMQRLRR